MITIKGLPVPDVQRELRRQQALRRICDMLQRIPAQHHAEVLALVREVLMRGKRLH